MGERLIAMACAEPAVEHTSEGKHTFDENLVTFAEREIRRRQARRISLPSEIFGEGAWNVLLDLFVMGERGKPVSITDACIASSLPTTTALRYISALIDLELVVRNGDPKDARRSRLSLSEKGELDLRTALTAMITASRATKEIRANR